MLADSRTTGTRSHINILLSAYVSTGVVAVRDVIGALLRRLLSESILFEHDPDEVYFWLSSLPIGTRSNGTGAPNESPLLDEQTAVISFLDDCIQLGLKMPYGYIEEVAVLSRGAAVNNDYQDGGNAASPLLATIMEQVFAKVSADILCPLDVLAIVSFVRKLLVRLSGKQGSMVLLVQLSERLSSLPFNDKLTEEHAVVRRAVTREIISLKNYLHLLRDPTALTSPLGGSSSSVTDYLDRIENMPIRTTQLFLHIYVTHPTLLATSNALCQSSALELIDCARPIDAPRWREAIMRLISTISCIRRLAVGELLECLDAGQRLLQDPPFFALLKQTCPK
jgi:nucleolar pre-ribosomal-associated protein 1